MFLNFLIAVFLPALYALSSDISLLKSQIQKLQTEVANEKAEIKILRSKDQLQANKVSTLESEVSILKTRTPLFTFTSMAS